VHKLPVLTLCLIAALACITAFICLSGALTSRDTEYAGVTAWFSDIEEAAR
jgi:hypothetical protein